MNRSILAAFLCALALPSLTAADRPNVVLVITDDQGHGDLSCHGNPILRTPHIDKLHAESLRLTDFHVSPTCAPTRGALMSGHYTNRAGPWHTIMGRSFLFEGQKTLGEVFSSEGYATGLFGKWHLGDNHPFRPEDRGFTEVVRHGGGGIGQAPDIWDNAYFDDTYFHNGKPQKYQGYCTDVFFSEAKRFITESVTAGKPFFAYISTAAPHSPFHCPDKYWKPYLDKLPASIKSKDQLAIFYGMIANIDENVGSLRDWLAQKGLAENTLFIFMTDNGTASGANIFNSGMSGTKGNEADGGHRVPFFLHWPRGGFDKGTDINRLTAHIDILPTLVELCSLTPIDPSYRLDGKSLAPILRDPAAEWPDRTIITDSQRVKDPVKWKNCSIMTERWRLLNGKKLYDIKADPAQKSNIAGQHPEVVAKLRADYEAWWTDISPAFQTNARIIVGSSAENPSHLTSHDWLTEGRDVPWNHEQIRAAHQGTGKWALRVAEAGNYRITLRRWPAESGAAINEAIPAGKPVPGITAFRETPGQSINAKSVSIRIADFSADKPISENDSSATFEMPLPEGDVFLEAYFTRPDGSKLGTYYAEVEKL